eukprot:NODE_8184_length_718_cov_79.082353_g7932_i0.p1 GENE.NODE_8184_length_718_cov_79.082353_g7932_i0~~NODE_8184_length_718_cov_79.082353_g7932_i0.p1  ORF type:complete len:193 (+),score=35.81 NODE_8184_length_718_cov_79.082353_g7932_i0:85-663(+)
MRKIHISESVELPKEVTVAVKGRCVVVKGPRGILKRSFKHALYDMFVKNGKFNCECWFGRGSDSATCKTICTHVHNMAVGVTKGYRYKMRFAYAHFPINVNINEDGALPVVEIRNFLGEKFVRKVQVRPGVSVTRTDPTKMKDEIVLEGNDLEEVSRSCADIHQSVLVKGKDIRKFLDGIYVSVRENVVQEE